MAVATYGYAVPAAYGGTTGAYGGLDQAPPGYGASLGPATHCAYDAALQGLPSYTNGGGLGHSASGRMAPPPVPMMGRGERPYANGIGFEGDPYGAEAARASTAAGAASSAAPGGYSPHELATTDGAPNGDAAGHDGVVARKDPRLEAMAEARAQAAAAQAAQAAPVGLSGPGYADADHRAYYVARSHSPGGAYTNGYGPRIIEGYDSAPGGAQGHGARGQEETLYREHAPREYVRIREPIGDYRTPTAYRAASAGPEYRSPSMEYRTPIREPLPNHYGVPADYVEVTEAPRDVSYSFPTAGSFVAEPYREGAPCYGPGQRSYPSGAYPERPRRDVSPGPAPGRYATGYAGACPDGYHRGYDQRSYGYSGGGGYTTGGGQYDMGGYGRYGPSYGRGDPYAGGYSRTPPRGGGYGGGAGAAYPGSAAGYGGGLPTSSALAYGLPTAGSFIAEPFAPGAPQLGARASSYGPPQYGGGYDAPATFASLGRQYGAYGGGGSFGAGGAASPFPPMQPSNASFLAPMPDGPGYGALGAAGFGGYGTGQAGGMAGGFGQVSNVSAGLGGGSRPSATQPGATEATATGPSAVSRTSSKPLADPLAPLPLGAASGGTPGPAPGGPGATGSATAAGGGGLPERPPYRGQKPLARPELSRSKKAKGRLGCC